MKNDLKRSKLGSSIIPLYIASWDGTQSSSASGITKCNSSALKEAIDFQLGTDMSFNFLDNFVNYKLGYILCVNTPALLNKFYKADPQAALLNEFHRADPQAALLNEFCKTDPQAALNAGSCNPIRFSKVLMPSEFIGKQNSLSSKYKIGEKISVRAGYEIIDKKQIIVYRDINAKGRSRLKTGGGGAVAVWS